LRNDSLAEEGREYRHRKNSIHSGTSPLLQQKMFLSRSEMKEISYLYNRHLSTAFFLTTGPDEKRKNPHLLEA
jgi:hypothetical protein